MTSDLAYPAQKEFSFLQTVVNEELGHRHERKDSNKHAGTGEHVSTLKVSTFTLPDRPGNTSMGDNDEPLSGFSRKDENGKKIWEDFLTDEEIQGKKGSKDAQKEVTDETKCASSGQSEKPSETVAAMSHSGGKVTDGSHAGVASESVAKKKTKNHMRKQGAVAVHPPAPAVHPPAPAVHPPAPAVHPPAPPATSGSQPNLSRHGNRARETNGQDTRSETEGRPRRRLGRRQRVSPVRRAGLVTSEQILHQRIQELHTLMVTPLMEPAQYLHQTRQELLRLQGFSQQRAAQLMGCLPQQQSGRRVGQQSVGEWNSTTSDDGYSVLRSAQLHRAKPQRPWTSGYVRTQPDSGDRHQRRPYSAEHPAGSRQVSTGGNTDSASPAGSRQVSTGGNTDSAPSVSVIGSKGGGHGRKHHSQIEEANDHSTETMNIPSGRNLHAPSAHTKTHQSAHRSDGTREPHTASPTREIEHLDTHLKHTHNPALRKWLKQKNKELRRQKAEERKRLREERAKKQDEVRARQEMFKDSEKKVKEWMLQKQKDARKRAEDIRREIQENNKFRADREHQGKVEGVLRTRSLEHLSARASSGSNLLVPGIRPSTGQGEVSQHSCEPSISKFVYKRPVSGHVTLIKLQQQQQKHAKKSEEEKILQEQKLAEAKSRKMRMSYDQWLVKKREEDYTKRQDMAKQKTLAKSDPELERILPELARRRIDNIQRGKKRVDTGIRHLDSDVKTRLAEDPPHTETPENTQSGQERDIIEVSGQKQVPGQPPATAKSSLHPQESTSPRRPRSANLKPSGPLDASSNGGSPPKPFKLPFPPQDGAPKYVLATQKRLFSSHVTTDLPRSPEAHQQEAHVGSDCPPDSNTIPDQMALETLEDTTEGDKQHRNRDLDSSRFGDGSHEADNSFFVTHGNLGHVRGREEQPSHTELGQTGKHVPEGDHRNKSVDELDVSSQEHCEHSTTHSGLQASDVPAGEDDDKINNTEDETCESDISAGRDSNGRRDGAILEDNQSHTQDERTEHQANIPEGSHKMAVLQESPLDDNLELSGHGVAGKHVTFQATDVVHEVSAVSEASDEVTDEVTDEGTGEDQCRTTEATNACEDKEQRKASLDNKQDDDDEDLVIEGENIQQATRR